MPRKFIQGDAARLAKIAGLTLLLPGCLTNSPKAVVTDASVTESKIAGDAVTSDKIKNGTIATVDLADSSVTTAKIASGVAITGSTSSWSGAVTMASTLAVTGATTVGGAITGSSSLQIDGNTTLGNATTDTLTIAAATSLTNSLSMTQTSTQTAAGNVYGISNTFNLTPAAPSATTFMGSYNYVSQNTAQDNTSYIVATSGQFNNTAAGTITAGYGLQGVSQNSAAGTITASIGTIGRAYNTNNGALIAGTGVYGDINSSSTGTTTTGVGVHGGVVNTGTGTITTGYALRGALTNSGGGAVTTYHGLHLDDPGTGLAANQYNIYSAGNVRNYIAGRLGVGQLAPAYEVDVTGDINATGCLRSSAGVASGVCVSDRMLKKEIAPFSVGLSEIIKLQPRLYKYNGLAGTPANLEEVGFIAQEVEEVIPGMVSTKKVKLREGDKSETTVKAVNYTRFIYIAFNAIRELYGKWNTDHQQLNHQKEQIASLERKIELENIALRTENKALKDRLEKIEQALAISGPKPEPKQGRKLASVKASR